ncbi:TetR/AcrR family transcriptional regulator [Pseudactinotalea sp.]|uniref:TetR/AcrR family transcriptional regulator n=1 Tax=Pseudactinotalea sp. TaxID=1926260 RepID=UPI003B3A6785
MATPARARRTSDTRSRIQAVALELFTSAGLERTSLQQIADRLGLTKPALYYHFASRDELVLSLLQPFVDDIQEFLGAQQSGPRGGDRTAFLESYVDLLLRHRDVSRLIVQEPAALDSVGVGTIVEWRYRLIALLVGADADPADQIRATVAVGGLADCTVMFPDTPPAELRRAAVAAAAGALGE